MFRASRVTDYTTWKWSFITLEAGDDEDDEKDDENGAKADVHGTPLVEVLVHYHICHPHTWYLPWDSNPHLPG